MEDEIYTVNVTQGGDVLKMEMKQVDEMDWDEIPKGKNAIITLVNGEQMVVVINSADDDGISFRPYGSKQLTSLYYDSNVIHSMLVEV